MDGPENIPESGAIFTFGSGKLTGSATSCFWLKNDVVISASCGDEHTALVTDKGKVYVYGSNNWGQLGLGNTNPSNKPACVKSLRNHKATMVACGRNHTLVCTSDNRIFAFGNNSDYQLGVEAVSNSDVPVEVSTEGLGKIKQIAAGADFSVVLSEDGNVYTWGSNAEGQLGLGSSVNEVTKPIVLDGLEQMDFVACGYYHTVLVSRSGDLYTFGEDEYGKLGEREGTDTCVPSRLQVPSSLKFIKAACGGSHSAFLSRNGELYTIGGGSHGELGHGPNILHQFEPKLIAHLEKREITKLSCGENFTSVVTNNGRLYTFGDGRHGKLALDGENFANQFTPSRCSRFKKYNVSFAICGGCHMVVSASPRQGNIDDSDSENERPVENHEDVTTKGKGNLEPDKMNGHLTSVSPEHISGLSRTLSAREKRRQGRKLLSQTLPPLRTLKLEELAKAAKSLPKPSAFHQSISSDWPNSMQNEPMKDIDQVSEISAFNKVHRLVKVGNLDALMPIQKGVIDTNKAEENVEYNAPVKDESEVEEEFESENENDEIDDHKPAEKPDTGQNCEVTRFDPDGIEDDSDEIEEDEASLVSEEEDAMDVDNINTKKGEINKTLSESNANEEDLTEDEESIPKEDEKTEDAHVDKMKNGEGEQNISGVQPKKDNVNENVADLQSEKETPADVDKDKEKSIEQEGISASTNNEDLKSGTSANKEKGTSENKTQTPEINKTEEVTPDAKKEGNAQASEVQAQQPQPQSYPKKKQKSKFCVIL